MTWDLVVAAAVLIAVALAYREEKRAWNNGRCRRCGAPLERFDTDSQGGRGYACSENVAHNGPWISYPVDR